MMKTMAHYHRVALVILVSTVPLLGQYGFNFTCLSDTVQVGTDYIVFSFQLENTGSAADSYALDLRLLDSLPGWNEQFCAGGTCAQPGFILFDFLLPGLVDTAIHVQIWPVSTGTEILNLHVESVGDTTLKDSINIYAVSELAVEEFADIVLESIDVFPNPFTNRVTIRLRTVGGIGRDCEQALHIYSIDGRLIKAFNLQPSPGTEQGIEWDGRDEDGGQVQSGVYVVRAEGRNTTKIILIR